MLGAGLRVIIDIGTQALLAFLGQSGGVNLRPLQQAVRAILDQIRAIVNFLALILGREHQAWQDAEPQIVDGANGLGQVAYNEAVAWQHLLVTILPGSLSWLDGHTHQWVDAKYDWQLNTFWRYFRGLFAFEGEIRSWRRAFVDPSVVAANDFRRWFDGWPRGIVFRWRQWFNDPGLFGEWAGGPVARPLLDHISQPSHRILRDQFALLWLDAAGPVNRAVERAAVTVLLSER